MHTDDALKRYEGLDLSADADAARALMARAEHEAGVADVTLTTDGEAGVPAAMMTAAMRSWFTEHVAPSRSAAVAGAQEAARGVEPSPGTPGVLLRSEHDAARRHHAKRRSDNARAFREANATLLERRQRARAEHDTLRFEEGGRDAKTPSHWLEFGVLFPLIMLPEGLLNFESFRRAPMIQSDFMALGATLIVGLGIGIAAYLIGRFVRQVSHYMRADSATHGRTGWSFLAIGVVTLLVALGVVGYARYYYLLPQLQEAIILGQAPPNIFLQTGSLLLGNLVVFLIGVAVTFLLNDPNPDYSDKARLLKKLDRKATRLHQSGVLKQRRGFDRALKEAEDKATSMDRQMSGQDGYADLTRRVARIEAKDGEVASLLDRYKEALLSSGATRFSRTATAADRTEETEAVSEADFRAHPIVPSWSVS